MKMIPAPIPSPRPPLQHRQSAVGSSEYIAAADIASPTFPPTFHHSNNHCHMHMANGSFDLIQQSTLVEYNVDCTANNITSQQQALHDDNLEHSVTGKSSHQQSSPPLHGTIITPNGLVAVIKVPTLDVIEADNMISSQMYPGYVEHKINDTHL